jgi:hypothetical protein
LNPSAHSNGLLAIELEVGIGCGDGDGDGDGGSEPALLSPPEEEDLEDDDWAEEPAGLSSSSIHVNLSPVNETSYLDVLQHAE